MSALSPVSYEPIRVYRVQGTVGFPAVTRDPEDITQTFKLGVPLRYVAGMLQECTFSAADVVAGVSNEAAHNLAAANTAQDLSEATAPNQASSKITPVGAWPRDGKLGYYHADGITTFSIALKAGQVYAASLLIPGTLYRLIKDSSSGFWYLDNTLTGGNAGVANLLGVDPSCPNTVADGSRVYFTFAPGQRLY